MAEDMVDLEKALRAMDDAAPAPATAGGEQNALIPADLRVHPMGGGAINKFAAKLNPDLLKWPLVYYCLLVVSVLALTNHLFVSKNQLLTTPMLTVIFVFLVFLAAICLLFRAVIKQAAWDQQPSMQIQHMSRPHAAGVIFT